MIKIARIFNTYGAHMQAHDGRVVSNFVVQALSGQPLTLYGQGAQTRSFCHVSDTVEALLRLMDSGDEVTGPHDRLVRRHGLTCVERRTKPSRLLGNTDPLRAMN